MRHSVRPILAVSIALSIQTQLANGASGSETVLELLADRCVKCHNAKQSAGGLRLDFSKVYQLAEHPARQFCLATAPGVICTSASQPPMERFACRWPALRSRPTVSA